MRTSIFLAVSGWLALVTLTVVVQIAPSFGVHSVADAVGASDVAVSFSH